MRFLKKLLSYPLSIIFYLCFALTVLVFIPIQWLALNLGGYQAHKRSGDYLSLALMGCLYILGTRIKFNNKQKLPKNVPLIFVSNHQSIYDICPIIFFLRKYHPKFVAKIELSRGFPSISFYLRHGGNALIDRNDPKQSLRTLINFGKYIEDNTRSAVIFPEGTRSKDGFPKRFSDNGMKILVRSAPSAYAVPLTINNSWKLSSIGAFPINIGVKIDFEVHKPIKTDSMPFDELFSKTEKVIKDAIISPQ
jgi:1-acyl-sn-glycerol-3-phosphate acyltransferase